MSEIPEYPNYLIYRDGRIWSKIFNKFLKSSISKTGYYKITLSQGYKKRKTCKIHRLLALTFIPNPDNNQYVDHIDRNKLNNNLDNLRWVTSSTNCVNRALKSYPKKKEFNYRHIVEHKGGYKIIIFRNGKRIFQKESIKWSLEYAITLRNEVYSKLGIDIDD